MFTPRPRTAFPETAAVASAEHFEWLVFEGPVSAPPGITLRELVRLTPARGRSGRRNPADPVFDGFFGLLTGAPRAGFLLFA